MKSATFWWPWIFSLKRSQTSPEILHEKSSNSYLPDDTKDARLWWIFADFGGHWSQPLVESLG
jgi:hypothetical protein